MNPEYAAGFLLRPEINAAAYASPVFPSAQWLMLFFLGETRAAIVISILATNPAA